MYPTHSGLIDFYGNPSDTNGELNLRWERENIVDVPCPWPIYASWLPTTRIRLRMHKKCANDLQKILKEIWSLYEEDTSGIEKHGLHLCGGTFTYRVQRGGSRLSTHAFGAAIDIDPERNGLGNKEPYMPMDVVKIFEDHGWVWGGRWRRRPDGMHFQACK